LLEAKVHGWKLLVDPGSVEAGVVPWRGEISDMAFGWMRYDGRMRWKNRRNIVRMALLAVAIARQL